MGITFSANSTVISDNWGTFLSSVTARNLSNMIQYVEDSTTYSIFVFDGPLVFSTTIWTGTVPDGVVSGGYTQVQNDLDKAEFEGTYKPEANKTLEARSPDGVPISAERILTLGNERFLRTDDGTEQMALNGLPAGGITVIWNGTGVGDTGGDWTSPAVGVESAAAAHSGTNGWDTQAQGANTNVEFNNGSEINVAGTYDVFSFWLQPKSFPNNGTLQIQWKNAVGTVIGATLNVENYVTNMDLNVWQKVSIPVSDFALTGNVQRCVFVLKSGNNQRHWIDDIEFQASGGGGPYTFQVVAPSTEAWHATMIVLVVATSDVGWQSTTFTSLTALTNGVLLRQRRLSDGYVSWAINAKDNVDLFGRYHPQESFNFSNGEILVGFMVKPGQSADIIVTDDDVLEFVIRDDLSSLTNVRAFVHYGVEQV